MRYINLIIVLLIVTSLLTAKVKLIDESEEELLIEFDIGKYTITENDNFTQIRFPKASYSDVSGMPNIPSEEINIAVPFDGYISVSVMNIETEKLKLSKLIEPIPFIFRGEETNQYSYEMNLKQYQDYTSSDYKIHPARLLGDLRVIPLQINPFLFDYSQNELVLNTKMKLKINIYGDKRKTKFKTDRFNTYYKDLIINNNTAVNWKKENKEDVFFAPFNKSNIWYKIEVSKDGMYEILYDDLLDTQFVNLNPSEFRIFSTGGETQSRDVDVNGLEFKEIMIEVEGESDGSFDSGDRIIFYGRDRNGFDMNRELIGDPYNNPFSSSGVYWLTIGDFEDNPKRIHFASGIDDYTKVLTSHKAVVRRENEHSRMSISSHRSFDSILSESSNSAYQYNFDVTNISNNERHKMKVAYQAENNTSHRISFWVNNDSLGVHGWSGSSYSSKTIYIDELQNGQNTMKINIDRLGSGNIYLDYFQITYNQVLHKNDDSFKINVDESSDNLSVKYSFNNNPNNVRIYQVNDFNSVSKLIPETGSENLSFLSQAQNGTSIFVVDSDDYLSVDKIVEMSVTDLTSISSNLDCLIISPEVFLDHAEQIKQIHQNSYDKNSLIINLEDIFNQFNSGMVDPNAIRDFLEYAYYNYNYDNELYVLFLGSGTNDWRNFSGLASEKNKFPVFLKDSYVSDDYYSYFTSESNPVLPTGRIPAKNIEQMNEYISRMKKYIENPNPGFWKNQVLILADDENHSDHDPELHHSTGMEETYESISPGVFVDKIFGVEHDLDEFRNKPTARNEMISHLNEGRLIWYYIGHGAFDKLGDEDYFQAATDIPKLDNRDRLPIFLAASCDVGQYHSYTYESLAEKVLFATNGGAIASIAATDQSFSGSNEAMFMHYLDYSLNNHDPASLALQKTKMIGTLSWPNKRKYNLLGDPIMLLTSPERVSNIQFNPEIDSLQIRQEISFESSFNQNLNGVVETYIYDTVYDKEYIIYNSTGNSDSLRYSANGSLFFSGNSSVDHGDYAVSFIVTDDIKQGNRAKIVSFFHDESNNKDYIDYLYPVNISGVCNVSDNNGPSLDIWLDSYDYNHGDEVSSEPLLLVNIYDENGINTLGYAGHKILLNIDNGLDANDITEFFNYDLDSYTSGKIEYKISNLEEGEHILKLVVFDNFNNFSIAETSFRSRKKTTSSITNLFPYPNPMNKNGFFTFELSDASEVKISIYSITGRKIIAIDKVICEAGYNQIEWDCRDGDGDRIANNTYFYRIKAKNIETGNISEKTSKFIIYH